MTTPPKKKKQELFDLVMSLGSYERTVAAFHLCCIDLLYFQNKCEQTYTEKDAIHNSSNNEFSDAAIIS